MELKKLSGKKRSRTVAKGIHLTWVSLESHLDYAHKHSLSKKPNERKGDYEFHKKCVQDYAEVIRILSLLY